MKFVNYSINGTTVEMKISEGSTLGEILEEFQNFLRACGYVIEYDKVLAIVEMDE